MGAGVIGGFWWGYEGAWDLYTVTVEGARAGPRRGPAVLLAEVATPDAVEVGVDAPEEFLPRLPAEAGLRGC